MRACWSTRAAAAVLTAGLLVPTLAACGDDEPGATQDPTSGASSDEGSTDEPSGEPTDEPTDETSVEPAAGQQVNTPSFSLNLPEGWRGRSTNLSGVTASPIGDPSAFIVISELDVPGGKARSLEELARDAGSSEVREPEIFDPVEVDSEMLYHVGGPDGVGNYIDEFGPSVEEKVITFTFRFDLEVPDDERQAVVDSVLASVDWTL